MDSNITVSFILNHHSDTQQGLIKTDDKTWLLVTNLLCNAGNHIVVFLSVIQLFFRVHLERVFPMRFVCPALLLEKVSCCSNPIACGDDTDAPI